MKIRSLKIQHLGHNLNEQNSIPDKFQIIGKDCNLSVNILKDILID